jgi:hypothetical protein
MIQNEERAMGSAVQVIKVHKNREFGIEVQRSPMRVEEDVLFQEEYEGLSFSCAYARMTMNGKSGFEDDRSFHLTTSKNNRALGTLLRISRFPRE